VASLYGPGRLRGVFEARGCSRSAEQFVCQYVPDGSAADQTANVQEVLEEADYAQTSARLGNNHGIRRGLHPSAPSKSLFVVL
jgi:hypothetical protein